MSIIDLHTFVDAYHTYNNHFGKVSLNDFLKICLAAKYKSVTVTKFRQMQVDNYDYYNLCNKDAYKYTQKDYAKHKKSLTYHSKNDPTPAAKTNKKYLLLDGAHRITAESLQNKHIQLAIIKL